MSKKIQLIIPNKTKPNLHVLFHAWIDRVSKDRKNSRSQYDDIYDEWEYLAEMGLLGIYPSEDDFDDCDVVFPYNSRSKARRNGMSDDDAYEMFWQQEEEKRRRRAAREARKNGNIIDAEYVEYSEVDGGKKKHKHRSKGKGKKNKIEDLNVPYSGWEEDPDIVGDGTNFHDFHDYLNKTKNRRDSWENDIDERERFDDHAIIWYYPNYANKDDRLEFNSLKDFDDFCADEGFVVPPYIAEEIAYRPISHVCLRPDARERGIYEIFAAESYADMAYEVCDVTELGQ